MTEILPGNFGVSLLTRGTGFVETGKSWLLHNGLGSSPGPLILEKNLLKGLKKIGAEFNIDPENSGLFSNICILRSLKTLQRIKNFPKKNLNLIVGPNLKAQDMAKFESLGVFPKFFLAPSLEVKKAYEYYGVPKEKIIVWPVGIDTECFKDTSEDLKFFDALVYFKRRRKPELEEVLCLLKNYNQTFRLLEYGKYSPKELHLACSQCKYSVVLDGTESQGIAIESIMSSNLPMFVLDQIYLGEFEDLKIQESLQVTSVPYWGEMCGIKVLTDSFGKSPFGHIEIAKANLQFEVFLKSLKSFQPRKYILKNLTLEKQAQEFLNIFKI